MIKLNRRGFLFGSAAAATLAGCSTSKVGLRKIAPGERRRVALIGFGICQPSNNNNLCCLLGCVF